MDISINTNSHLSYDIRRGDIFYVMPSPNRSTVGSEQGIPDKGRPALIIQNDAGNKNSETVIVAYLTLKVKTELPTHVHIDEGEAKGSIILLEQICTVSYLRIGNWKCTLDEETMKKVDKALAVSLGLKLSGKNTTKEIEQLKMALDECTIKYDDLLQKNEHLKAELERATSELSNTPVQGESTKITRLRAQLDVYKTLYQDLLKQSIK